MREIKFRAWDVDRKQMRYRGFVLEADGTVLVTRGPSPADLMVMQFTGLTDKNGKEIYEGDILEIGGWGYDSERGVVKYYADDGYPAFDIEGYDAGESNGFAFIKNGGEVECEVIGNIYENPELL